MRSPANFLLFFGGAVLLGQTSHGKETTTTCTGQLLSRAPLRGGCSLQLQTGSDQIAPTSPSPPSHSARSSEPSGLLRYPRERNNLFPLMGSGVARPDRSRQNVTATTVTTPQTTPQTTTTPTPHQTPHQLTKTKICLNNRKITNHPPSPDQQQHQHHHIP